MNYLLDTHTLIWFLEDNPKISKKADNIIKDKNNSIDVSVASFWEMAIKLSIGKLKLPEPLPIIIQKTKGIDIEILQLHTDYILKIENLPFHHKDPFDRIIITTAITEQLSIISIDEKFDKYEVKRIW
ncbi:MAG: type II toxin-antitoxin system VapC family toxin [Bacteroidetes bacterium]|nr:type II toxin-antitoxin system VapC family toxin [Bacteroidota bacterium]